MNKKTVNKRNTLLNKNNLPTVQLKSMAALSAANSNSYQVPEITLKRLNKDLKIWKWMDKFSFECTGNIAPRSILIRKNADFYRIDLKDGGCRIGVGFIRIVYEFKDYPGDFNCLAIIYIDPMHRGKGIYDYILRNNFDGVLIDSVLVNDDAYVKHQSFFCRRGFEFLTNISGCILLYR